MILILWDGKLLDRIEKGCAVCNDIGEALTKINDINAFGEIQFKMYKVGREIKIEKKSVEILQPSIIEERYVLK